jgi:hypothetical protein
VPVYILGSAAAADCVQIGAIDTINRRIFLVHATRQTDLAFLATAISVLKLPDFYLSSQAMTTQVGMKEKSLYDLVVEKINQASGATLRNSYPTGALAINAKTLEVEWEVDKNRWAGTHTEKTQKTGSGDLGKFKKIVDIPSFKGKTKVVGGTDGDTVKKEVKVLTVTPAFSWYDGEMGNEWDKAEGNLQTRGRKNSLSL